MSDSFDDSSNLCQESTDDVIDIDNQISETKSKKASKEKPKRPPKVVLGNLFSSSKSSTVENEGKVAKAPCRPPPPKIVGEAGDQNIEKPVKTLLDRTPEEKSSEWWEFQAMQERISTSVQHSKSSLHKLAKAPETATENSQEERDVSPTADKMSWTSFDSYGNVVEPKHDFKLNEPLLPGIPNLYTSLYEDKLSQSSNIQRGKNLPHLAVSPLPSPQLAPKPPANSLNVSMEDLSYGTNKNNSLNLLDFDGSSSVTDSALVGDDLLGFLSGNVKKRGGPQVAGDFMDVQSMPKYEKQDSTAMSLVYDFLGISGDDDKQINPMNQSIDLVPNSFDVSHKIPSEPVFGSSVDSNRSITNGDLMAYTPDTTFDPFIVNTVIPPHSAFAPPSDAASQQESRVFNPFLETHTTHDIQVPVKTDIVINRPSASKPIDPFQLLFNTAKSDDTKVQESSVEQRTKEDTNKGYELIASKRASVQALLDIGFMSRNAEQLSAAAVSPIIEPSNAFLCSLTQDDRSPSVNELDDDNFFTKESSGGNAVGETAWGTNTDAAEFKPTQFVDDDFSSKHISEFNDDATASAPTNPFLSNAFDAAFVLDTSVINPFITEAVDLTNKKNASSDFDTNKPYSVTKMDSFDPFATQEVDPVSETFDPFQTAPENNGKKSPDEFQAAVLAGSSQLVQPDPNNFDDELEDGMFHLEIRSSAIQSAPVPPLPPPPKISTEFDFDETPSRINPFDNDSPAEENFAEFPVQPVSSVVVKKSESISSDDTVTPEGESNVEPLTDYHPKPMGDGWTLMIRQPVKKKLTTNRVWKEVYVRILLDKGDNPLIKIFSDDTQRRSNQELPLQPCYSLSDLTLQQYDQYGKIHTFKLQYVFYKERMGLRAERLTPNFVKKPKPTMILDHSPQISELLKFGSLDKELLRSFIWALEDALMNLKCQRDKTLNYTKDDVTMELWDEYEATIDKTGHVKDTKARVRIFCLAFLTGMPECELGVNDRRRKGKEVVGRHDIIPVKTEEWIRMEDVKLHSIVNQEEYGKTSNIKFRPLDACQFEVMRFRVRLRKNLELPLHVSIEQTLDERHLEIRCNLLVTGFHANTKKYGQFPCENIEVHFPIPECWIYMFRVERRFGYGSVKSIARKPGKIKGIERITMLAQSFLTPTLMETSTGTAKYEHIYRSVVWRVPKLPERNQGAYTNHVFILKIDLGSHDDIPESFEPHAYVEFSMPASTVSKAQIRSFSVDNPNPPEKWVKYIAKYKYVVEITHTTVSDETGVTESAGYGGEVGDVAAVNAELVEEAEGDKSDDSDSDSEDGGDGGIKEGDAVTVEQPGY